MSSSINAERAAEKAQRRAARELVGACHQEELRRLLDHARAGFARLDAGDIDEFDLDDLIHQYKKAAAKLWSFCETSGERGRQSARLVEHWRAGDDPPPDWWAEAAPRRRHTS